MCDPDSPAAAHIAAAEHTRAWLSSAAQQPEAPVTLTRFVSMPKLFVQSNFLAAQPSDRTGRGSEKRCGISHF
jgi:hypothetical protein